MFRRKNPVVDAGSPLTLRVKVRVITIPLIWSFILYAGVIVLFFWQEIEVPTYWKPPISVACYIPLQMICYTIYFNWKGLKVKNG